METIRMYLENIFQRLPDTPESRETKKERLRRMKEKYEALTDSGKSENEAIGIVIAELGDFEEIRRELNLSRGRANGQQTKESYRMVFLDEATDFLEFQRKYAAGISMGVACCIFSPSILMISEESRNGGGILQALGFVFLLCFVALGVGLFIYYGMKSGEYDDLRNEPFYMEEFAEHYIEKMQEDNEGSFRIQVTLGVILCIVSMIPVLVIDEILLGKNGYQLEGIGVALMFVFIAAGVFCFVFGGIVRSGYDVMLQKGEYKLKKKIKHINKR